MPTLFWIYFVSIQNEQLIIPRECHDQKIDLHQKCGLLCLFFKRKQCKYSTRLHARVNGINVNKPSVCWTINSCFVIKFMFGWFVACLSSIVNLLSACEMRKKRCSLVIKRTALYGVFDIVKHNSICIQVIDIKVKTYSKCTQSKRVRVRKPLKEFTVRRNSKSQESLVTLG